MKPRSRSEPATGSKLKKQENSGAAMGENGKHYYFSAVKLFCMVMLIGYFISNSKESLHNISVEWFLLAVVMIAALGIELVEKKEKKFIFLCFEVLLTVMFLVIFKKSNNGLFLFPMVVLDLTVFFRLPMTAYLFTFSGLLLQPEDIYLYAIYCLFLMIIYFQNNIIIEKYKRYMEGYEQKEYQLKDTLSIQDAAYKEQLARSSLSFENRLLEEKAVLSQALHDKLGHSINGSIYQLEACKVLMKKEPEESERIMQAVIDSLRTSMDEIRVILRREKPDKKRMAYLKLVQLSEECREKFGIKTEFTITGQDREVSEPIWEVILDNSIEAVTNALKYAGCTELYIEIIILHKVIRCSIRDNGNGCELLKEGMGIQGMKNRVRNVNGYIDISSKAGFLINMIIPLS